MPNSLSSKKRLRQNVDHRLRNRSAKAALRTQIRKLRTAIQGSDVEASQKEYILVTKKLDQAASKNIIHANQAARLKSRLSAAIKKIKAAKASA